MAERPEDLNLPNAVVTRIIKEAIPEGVNVSKEARLAISKAASVFVLYATSCSNNFALKGKRKTISAQDVITAMEDMEFDQFAEPLRICLQAYRSGLRSKKEASERKRKEKVEEILIEDKDDTNDGVDSDEEQDNGIAVEMGGDDNNYEINEAEDSDVVEISDEDG